jgi:putative endonuclease
LQSRTRDDRRAFGAEGEARAARYLAERGYRIVDRNVRAGGVELDLVVRKGRTVAFVEVKARRTRRFGAPEEAVDAAKQRRLIRGAHAWLHANGSGALQVRFDVVACDVDAADSSGQPVWRIRHLKAAFDAGD